MNNQTIEELEIVIRARVDEATKEIKGLTNQIQKEVSKSTKELEKLTMPKMDNKNSFKPIVSESKELAKTLSNDVSNATKLTTKDLQKMANAGAFKELEQCCKELSEYFNNMGSDNEWLEQKRKDFEEIKRMAEVNPTSQGWQLPLAQKDLELAERMKTKEAYDKAVGDSVGGFGKMPEDATEEIKKQKKEASKLSQIVDGLKMKWEQVKGSVGGATAKLSVDLNIGRDSKQAKQYQMSKLKDQLSATKEAYGSTRNRGTDENYTKEQKNAELEQLRQQIDDLKSKIAKLNGSADSGLGGSGKGFGGILNGFKKGSSNVSEFGKTLEKSLGGALKTIKRFSVGLLGVQSAYRILSRATSSYLAYDQELQKSMQNSWNVLGSLLAPALEFIINLFAKAVSYVANFVKALTGIDLVARANAKSLKKQANASKQLSGLDDINNLTSDSQNPITTMKVDTGFMDDIADKLKNGLFYEVGESIAQAMNDAMAKIDMSSIVEKGKEIATGLAQGINGFFATFDFSTLGTLISDGIRGILQTANTFLTEINWQQIGTDIGNFLLSIDWGGIFLDLFTLLKVTIPNLLMDLLIGLLDSIIDALNDPEFFAKVVESGVNVIRGIVEGMISVLKKIGEVFQKIIDLFKALFGIHSPSTLFAEFGKFIIEGLINGLKGLISAVGQVFSTLIEFIGGIFTGAWEKIKEIFNVNNVKAFFTSVLNGIKNVFSSVATFFKNIFTTAWTNVKNVFSSGGKIFSGIKEGIEETFKTIVNKLISGINTIVSVPFKAINKMLNTIRDVSFLDISPFKKLWNKDPLTVPQIPKLAKGNVATSPTLAMFGEYHNAKSNPEITAPQKTLEASFRKVMQETNNSGTPTRLVVNVGSTKIFDDMIDYANTKSRQNGVSVFTEI